MQKSKEPAIEEAVVAVKAVTTDVAEVAAIVEVAVATGKVKAVIEIAEEVEKKAVVVVAKEKIDSKKVEAIQATTKIPENLMVIRNDLEVKNIERAATSRFFFERYFGY
jgi:hypothetical protein